MKLIVAILKPHKLHDVREALSSIGVSGMTATEVKGFGRQGGQKEIYRGAEYVVNFVPKVKLEVAVTDDRLAEVVNLIRDTANTDTIGDGKVFVLDMVSAMRIRTGEQDKDAL